VTNITQTESKHNVYEVKVKGTKKGLGKSITVNEDKVIDELLEILTQEKDK